MSDAKLRERQRAWESNPGDQDALAAYIAALRGAGEVVPLELLSLRVFPARTLEVLEGWSVSIELGHNPDLVELTPEGSQVEVPEHRRLVVAIGSGEELRASHELLARQGILELALDCEGLAGTALSEIEALAEFEALRLFSANHLRAEDWSFLDRCSALHTFTTDHLDLATLDALPTSLQVLEVGAVDPTSLAQIIELAPRLRSLSLSGEQLAEADYASLEGLTELRSLHLAAPQSFSLEALVGLASLDLETLCVGRDTEFPEETLQHIADSFPNLQHLELRECFEDLGPLSPLPLRHLSLLRFGADARQLIEDTLEGLPRTLCGLELSARIGDLGLRSVSRLEELSKLDLQLSNDLNGEGLLALAELPYLSALRLSADELRPTALSALLEVKSLTELSLAGVSSEEVQRLGSLTRLQTLRLSGRYNSNLSAEALGACLEGLPNLDSLSITRARIGRALSTSHGFPELHDLSVFRSELSPESLADIAACRNLWFVHLLECGPMDGIQALTALPELEFFALTDCEPLSEAAIAHLRANLPDHVLDLGT